MIVILKRKDIELHTSSTEDGLKAKGGGGAFYSDRGIYMVTIACCYDMLYTVCI